MDAKRARELLPHYATAEPDDNNGWPSRTDGSELPPRNSKAGRMIAGTVREMNRSRMKDGINGFLKRNMIAILVLTAFALEGWIVAVYTENRVSKEVRATVEAEMRQGFQDYIDQMEEEKSAAGFLTGEASLQAAMDEEASALARLLYGYRNNSLRDRKTLIWCVLMRVDSKAYPNNVTDVVNQPQQWMFYSTDNPLRDDDRELAMEQLRAWHEGKYPAGLSTEFVYAEWSEHDIALRNEFKTSSSTKYWRIEE